VKAVLLDTSVVVAVLDRAQNSHRLCVEAMELLESPIVTCEAVITEACYLLRNVRGAAEAVMENIANGVFQIPFRLSISAADVSRHLRKYADLPGSFADACLIQLAGELGTGDILTLDRDFGIYRWGSNKPFRLLVELPR